MKFAGQRLRMGVAGIALGVTLTACGQAAQEPGGTANADLGIGHVHGLGVDPADGALYVAGHYGLFRITSPTAATRVADRDQDHMGFTIMGPKTFLASGHPSAEDVSPERPGYYDDLTKAPPLSHVDVLPGEVLVGAGADGRVHISQDSGRTWSAAGKLPAQAAAFAAVDRQHLLAALEDGTVLESKDGGKTFTTAAWPSGTRPRLLPT
jgi:hypothetical protein